MALSETGKFNAAFWKWFGDSKVVDKHGQPLVVYHGTGPSFAAFESGHRTGATVPRQGFYFTDDANIAKEFGSRIIAAYLSLQNPADFAEGGDFVRVSHEEVVTTLARVVTELSWDGGMYYKNGQPLSPNRVTNEGLLQTNEFTAAAKRAGYDGIIMDDALGHAAYFTTYIAFRPSQIKSVDNDGTWDANDPDFASNPVLSVSDLRIGIRRARAAGDREAVAILNAELKRLKAGR